MLNQVKANRTSPQRRLLRALTLIVVAIPQRVLLPPLRANSPQNALLKGAKQFEAGRSRQQQGKARRACPVARSRGLTQQVP